MDTTINELLKNLGLTENESRVYLHLLEGGNKTAAEVARKLSFDKSSTYRACEHLTRMGLLVSAPLKQGQKRGLTFIAQSPELLQDLYQQKLKELKRLGSEMDANVKLLQKMAAANARNTRVKVEYGLTALQNAMSDSLECKEKVIRERIIGNLNRYFNNREHTRFVVAFAKERARRGINIIQLENEDSFKDLGYDEIMTAQKKYLKKTRLTPPEMQDTSSLRIWDDTINIFTYDDNNEFLVITLTDKFVAELLKNMYDFIWNHSRTYGSA